MYALWGSNGQKVLQLGILKETQQESASGDLLVPPSYFIIEFLIPISIRMEGFITLHPYRQQSIYELWDFTACYESSTELLYQLIEISNWSFPQSVKPSHSCWAKTGREYLTHQPIIIRINQHHLYIMTYMLNLIGFSIINDKLWIGKRWLGSPP